MTISVMKAKQALEKARAEERRKAERREKSFQKLSSPAKRVAIAKDVIDQLNMKRIEARTGTYLEMQVKGHIHDGQEMREVISEGTTCTACAVGSIFACAVTRANQFTVKDVKDGSSDDAIDEGKEETSIALERSSMEDYLGDFFDEDQLNMMEDAFEQNCVMGSSRARDAISFGMRYKKPKERLIAIMKNVIENHGEFHPPEVPESAAVIDRLGNYA